MKQKKDKLIEDVLAENIKKLPPVKDVRIIPLAGVQEIGMNSAVVETPNDMVIVDAGMGFPETSLFGVDFLMPDYRYVVANKHKLRGILITHGHFDHIGALPYMLETLGLPPVYGPRFAIQLIQERLKEFDLDKKVKFIEVKNDGEVQVSGIKAHYFHVTHSIPDSCGIVIEAMGKKVMFTGDFKFDDKPFVTGLTSYDRIRMFGNQGIDVLLSDSTNSFQKGRADSDSEIVDHLEMVVKNAPGRVVVATFSSLVNRMQILISVAERTGRKVFISGRSMLNAYEIAKKWGYIKHQPDTVKNVKQIKGYTDSQIMLLTTGSQGEENAGLARIARDEHQDFKIRKGDTILLTASVIPGNAAIVQKLIDDLIIGGADVYHQAQMDLHTSGHGYQEDQKMMLEMTKPRYLMPVHGYQSHLVEHGHTAQMMGFRRDQVLIPRDGFIFEFEGSSLRKIGEIDVEHVFVDAYGVGEVGQAVLRERVQLANNGVVAIIFKVDWDKLFLQEKPQIFTRGFVYVKNSQELIDDIAAKAEEFFDKASKKYQKRGKKRFKDIRYVIEKRLADYIEHETGKTPLMMTVVY